MSRHVWLPWYIKPCQRKNTENLCVVFLWFYGFSNFAPIISWSADPSNEMTWRLIYCKEIRTKLQFSIKFLKSCKKFIQGWIIPRIFPRQGLPGFSLREPLSSSDSSFWCYFTENIRGSVAKFSKALVRHNLVSPFSILGQLKPRIQLDLMWSLVISFLFIIFGVASEFEEDFLL